jgi:hypothetical protein
MEKSKSFIPSINTDVDHDNQMITNTADKYFGLFYIGKKEQEESKILGTETEASRNIIPTIYWTSFHGFSTVTGTKLVLLSKTPQLIHHQSVTSHT